MREFPPTLNAKNKKQFNELYYNRVLCYLRKKLYEHIISHDENNYFELDIFQNNYKISTEDLSKMTNIVIEELENLGWKCKLSFGDSAIFIYSTDDPPKSCW
jgi:hypothetical protein